MLKRFLINFYENLKFYLTNISIHGLCNILKSPHWVEKIFWIIIFIFAVQYFYGMMYENLISFYNQPVTKSIRTTAYPISFVPFPAVTMCNFNIVYKPHTKSIEKIFNLQNLLYDNTQTFTCSEVIITEDDLKEMLERLFMLQNKMTFILVHVLDNGIDKEIIKKFFVHLTYLRTPMPIDISPYMDIYKILNQNGYSNNSKLMYDLTQPCNRMLKHCSWAGTELNCNKIFQTAKADFGFCCSFNSDLDPAPIGNVEYYTSAGPLKGLEVRFNIEEQEYLSPMYEQIGILIIVHNKDTYANSDYLFYTIAQPGAEASMKISPNIFEAENELDQLPVVARECWMDREGTKFLKMNYSFYNCMHMCKSDAIANMCNCIPHYHRDHAHLRTCTLLDMPCLLKNNDNFNALHPVINKNEENQFDIICDCLPSCTGINYVGTTEVLNFRDLEGNLQRNYSGVRVYFQNNFCTKYGLSRSMTPDSFIALVGGLFALCLGGSIVSVSELIYYFFKSIFENSEKRRATIDPTLYWSEFEVFEKIQKNTTNILLGRNTNYK